MILCLARPKRHLFVTDQTPDSLCEIMGWVVFRMEEMLGNYGRNDMMGELWGDLGRLGNVRDGCGSNGGNGNGLKQKGF